MDIAKQNLERAKEIIGERTPDEQKYNREVIRWLRRGKSITKAIAKANEKYPTEALQVTNDNSADVQAHYEHLADHYAIIEKLNALKKLILAVFIAACVIAIAPLTVQAQTEPPNAIFWKELEKLCGKAFAGSVAAAPADDTTFKDKSLVMHVRSCEKDRIRIPFVVGEDRSRTWVLTRVDDRILLKHDHRHEDGQPDKVTMYGGLTTSVGMPTRQMFPADQETVNRIPAAATNVWWIDLVPGEHFTYNLRRMGSERFFSIKFDLKTPVKAPAAPWGWKD